MAEEEWFRHTSWSKTIETRFFNKLNKARSQRDQYLVIQALTLVGRKPKIALSLADLYLETRKNDVELHRALETRAAALAELGRSDEMVFAYKQVIALEADQPNVKGATEYTYPFYVAVLKVSREYELALELLNASKHPLYSPRYMFTKAAARALIHWDSGRKFDAIKQAEIAVRLGRVQRRGLMLSYDEHIIGQVKRSVLRRVLNILNHNCK